MFLFVLCVSSAAGGKKCLFFMRIIFVGSGEFGVPTLSGLMSAGHEIVKVYTQPDRPAGRGRKLAGTPVAEFAVTRGIDAVRTGDINSEKLPRADLMVVIAFGQKVAPAVVNHARLGSVNLHASLVPKFRGAAPINWAILRGEKETGNSIIRLAEKMDAGALVAQSRLTIGETETAGELHDRLAKDGAELMARTTGDLEAGKISEKPQDESAATQAPKLSRKSAMLDWNRPGDETARTIRGLSPWPGCRARLLDAAGAELGRLTLLRAKPAASEAPRWHPGEIAIDGNIACGAGAVEILDVQPDGKRAMALADYRRGHQWMPGTRVESI
jgi:methionyl-tRNA formyltransferase